MSLFSGQSREMSPRLCQKTVYVPSKRKITSPAAVKALTEAIKKTSIYKYAEDFAKVFQNDLVLYILPVNSKQFDHAFHCKDLNLVCSRLQ